MQKIAEKLKNTPRNTSLVPCSVSPSLNKEETLSVMGKVLSVINPEVNQPVRTLRDLKSIKVYVLNIKGKPLMPCTPCKAKHLLKTGKAIAVKRFPFTIQLNFECENRIQKVILGIDSGYENIGFSAVSEIKELISGVVNLDKRTSERLAKRSMYRRGRRNKLWYRKPRFDNRVRKASWLPPSIQRRYDTHLNLIERLKGIIPVSETIIEVANFDIQKIMNPDIAGVEYQQGNLYEYQNIRSYLMAREHGKCQLCSKDFKDRSSHVHHCQQKSEVGSNRPANLAILHKACHDKLHQQGLKLSQPKSYKPNTFMSIIHKRFYRDISGLKVTYGYETFIKRNELGLEKSHSTDAFVIANGSVQDRTKDMQVKQIHRNNRVLQLNRKGFKPSIKRTKSKVNPEDLFWVDGKQYSCKAMFNKGAYICYGRMDKREYFKFSRVEKIFQQGSFAWAM